MAALLLLLALAATASAAHEEVRTMHRVPLSALAPALCASAWARVPALARVLK
jgi:hypothetical protein